MATRRSTIRTVSTAAGAALSFARGMRLRLELQLQLRHEQQQLRVNGRQCDQSPAHGKISVAISDYPYHPATTTVAHGTTVTFINHDQTATTPGSGFDTGTLKPGHRSSIQLGKRGSYTYYCQFHASMRGTIIVK
jgi:plastocyanin